MRSCPALFVSVFLASALSAQTLELPAVLSDHMVLQSNTDAPVWGRTVPGESVTAVGNWDGASPVRTVAGDDGRFSLQLPTPDPGGPFTVTVSCGDAKRTIADVLAGEVWLCSGQSNMEMPLAAVSRGYHGVVNSEAEIAAADHPQMRLFVVRNRIAMQPLDDCEGAWQVCSPETAAGFSGTGYFFGRMLLTTLKRPVGLIAADWGGTPAEAWTSAAGLKPLGDFDAPIAELRSLAESADATAKSRAVRIAGFWRVLDRVDPGSGEPKDDAVPLQMGGASNDGWMAAALDESEWTKSVQPGVWAGELESFDGVVWLRKSFEVNAEAASAAAVLELGPIDDYDVVWLNGARVGGNAALGQWNKPRRYKVPAQALRAGTNTLAIRVYDSAGLGGLSGEPASMRLLTAGGVLPLSGTYLLRQGTPQSALPRYPNAQKFNAHSPTSLYNGMIAPLQPFAMRGAIWYQGESNRMRAAQYRRLFPAMIEDWRRVWGATVPSMREFPFLFVQIAPFGYGKDRGQAAALREAQFMTLQSSPNTGMAVTMDVGNARDIHPKKKRAVGERLARWALAKTYDVAMPYTGPLYAGMSVEGEAIRVRFTKTEPASALRVRGGGDELTHFQVAGKDRVFHDAEARLDGYSVAVKSAAVAEPIAVRFAFGAADEPNLENAAGLPASSFRSDDWKL